MVIDIKVSRDRYIEYVVHFLNPLLKLRKREVDVLVALLKVWYSNIDKNVDSRLMGSRIRKKIRESLGMSEASYNNHLMYLRKKGVIKDGIINRSIVNLIKDGSFVITYKVHAQEGMQGVSEEVGNKGK